MSKYEKIKIIVYSVFGFGFLLCCYKYSEKDRYVFSNKTDGLPLILDSKTGEIYNPYDRKKISIDKYKSIK